MSALALVYLCFLLSGFAALVYQTAWTRQFAFVFGTSELAVATVLAAYMAGLAAGAAVAGRLSGRVSRPVRVYGLLELGIAVSAVFAVPAGIAAARWLYAITLGDEGALPDEGGATPALFYAVCSFLIVLIPTGLMGATLPLLARHAVRRDDEVARRVGSLYAVNTLGAVAGALCAGFGLLPLLGLGRTIWVAAACNAAIFAVAVRLSRRADMQPAPDRDGSPPALQNNRWILPLIALSGIVSFTYEVLWTRMLGHVMGGSIYAFSTMLAAFLTGIAGGSWVASRLARDARTASLGFAWVQLGIAALSVGAFFGVDFAPKLAQMLGRAGSARLAGDALVGTLTLLPAALCIGATFPLAVRMLCASADDAGPASARVYAWNTGGAIVGAIGAGFFLLPAVGFAGTLTVAVAVNLALALASALLVTPRARAGWMAAAFAVVGLAVLAIQPPPPPWNLLRASPLNYEPSQGAIRHYGVGRSAAVLMLTRRGMWQLRTNGLPESAIGPPGRRVSAFAESRWMAALPALSRPDASRQLFVGLGGGVVLEHVPDTVSRIDVVELEPEVVLANQAIAAERAVDPLQDPRVRLVMNDARGALLRTSERYDGIVSQPSHPWTTGASHLYTREFFELARSRMTADGVLVQWMGLHFIDEQLLRSLIATLGDVFAEVEVYQPTAEGVLFAASSAPLDPQLPSWGEPLGDLLGAFDRDDLLAVRLLDNQGARAYAQGAPIITDDRNWLLMRSPGIARLGGPPLVPSLSTAAHDPLMRVSADADRLYVVRRLLARGHTERAAMWIDTWPEDARRLAAQVLVEGRRGERSRAARSLERAIAIDPADRNAGIELLRNRRVAIRMRDTAALNDATNLSQEALLVLSGWMAEDREDWAAVRELEGELASFTPADPELEEALRLRVAWRLESEEESRAMPNLVLADRLVTLSPTIENLWLRTRAVAATGQLRGTFAAMFDLIPRLDVSRANQRRIAQQCRDLLAALSVRGMDDQIALDKRRLDSRLARLLAPRRG